MGKAQREKGKRGERELAGILRDYGYDTRRGQQFCGSDGSADVVGLPGIHIECKRVEKLNLLEAMEQAKHVPGQESFRQSSTAGTGQNGLQPCAWMIGLTFSGSGRQAGKWKGR